MSKFIKIERCLDCPYLDAQYTSDKFICNESNSVIKDPQKIGHKCKLLSDVEVAKMFDKVPRKKQHNEPTDEVMKEIENAYKLYQQYCPSLDKVDISKLTKRQMHIIHISIVRLEEKNLPQLFQLVATSSFLMGKGEWKADFLWIFNWDKAKGFNTDKIMSGKYNRNSHQSAFIDIAREYKEEF